MSGRESESNMPGKRRVGIAAGQDRWARTCTIWRMRCSRSLCSWAYSCLRRFSSAVILGWVGREGERAGKSSGGGSRRMRRHARGAVWACPHEERRGHERAGGGGVGRRSRWDGGWSGAQTATLRRSRRKASLRNQSFWRSLSLYFLIQWAASCSGCWGEEWGREGT